MPCFKPLQASYEMRPDGKKRIFFSKTADKLFYERDFNDFGQNHIALPCGKCIGCRLEQSRQWAVRCVHEMQMHEDNSFVTLTLMLDLQRMKADLKQAEAVTNKAKSETRLTDELAKANAYKNVGNKFEAELDADKWAKLTRLLQRFNPLRDIFSSR